MSQILLTDYERVTALQQFNYSEREARFLCLAGLHGGYFLRRQYGQFLGKEVGGTAAVLVEKLVANGHTNISVYDHNTHVYHLGARPFYAAMGQEDNRNRRERQLSTIKNKLMGLDFVLAHARNVFLATEQEKVHYFTGVLNVGSGQLPAKIYNSAKAAPTTRYFVEKYPIFLPEKSNSEMATRPSPVVSFCFVDEGLTTTSHFETFLEQYGQLFTALRAFQVVYVAARPAPFGPVERVLQKYVTARIGRLGGAPADPLIERLSRHFELRRQYEAKDFVGLDRGKLIELRNDRVEFAAPKYDALYELWKSGGTMAVRQHLSPETGARHLPQASFSTHLLEHNYDFFGTLTSY